MRAQNALVVRKGGKERARSFPNTLSGSSSGAAWAAMAMRGWALERRLMQYRTGSGSGASGWSRQAGPRVLVFYSFCLD